MVHSVSSGSPVVNLITTVTDSSQDEVNEENEDQMKNQFDHLLDCLVLIVIVKSRQNDVWSFIFTSLYLEHFDDIQHNYHNQAYTSDQFSENEWKEEEWSLVEKGIYEHQEANHFEEEQNSMAN